MEIHPAAFGAKEGSSVPRRAQFKRILAFWFRRGANGDDGATRAIEPLSPRGVVRSPFYLGVSVLPEPFSAGGFVASLGTTSVPVEQALGLNQQTTARAAGICPTANPMKKATTKAATTIPRPDHQSATETWSMSHRNVTFSGTDNGAAATGTCWVPGERGGPYFSKSPTMYRSSVRESPRCLSKTSRFFSGLAGAQFG